VPGHAVIGAATTVERIEEPVIEWSGRAGQACPASYFARTGSARLGLFCGLR
jgi:hypothetical protein